MDKREITSIIKSKAQELGFLSCGISKAEFLEEEAPRLEQWLKKGMHGKMSYMEDHFDKRLDPRLLFEGAESVISLSYNYYPSKKQREKTFKVAKYAYGRDYHRVLKKKLKNLVQELQEHAQFNARIFVDSAPILERAWAKKSGIGWVGKNTQLISKNVGSFYFLAEIILDIPLEYDESFKTDHCGTCTRCIDACPTQAIVAPFVLDSNKCISYLTIELKDEIPKSFTSELNDWIFGCDICQDVCPWNRFSKPHSSPELASNDRIINMSKSEWKELTKELFESQFLGSPLKRAKFEGLRKNMESLSL